MRKLIFIGIILFIPFSNFAIETTNFSLTPNCKFYTDDLPSRLAADKDFQGLCLFSYELTGKLKATNSIKLFQKVANHTATQHELTESLKRLNFKNKKSLEEYLEAAYIKKVAIQKKFPELLSLQDAQTVQLAARKVAINESFATKVQFRPVECWEWYAYQLTACSIGCSTFENYSECWWACFSAASSLYAICEILQ